MATFTLADLVTADTAFHTALSTIDLEFAKYVLDAYITAQETGVTPAAFDAIWSFFLSTWSGRVEGYCRIALYIAMVGVIPTQAGAKKRYAGRESAGYKLLHDLMAEIAGKWVEAKDALPGLPQVDVSDPNHTVKVIRQVSKVMSPLILAARVFLAKKGLPIWKPGVDFGTTPDVYKFPEASYMIPRNVSFWADYKAGYLKLLDLSKSFNKSSDKAVEEGIAKFIANNTTRIEAPPPQAKYYMAGVYDAPVKTFSADSAAKTEKGLKISRNDARAMVTSASPAPIIELTAQMKTMKQDAVKLNGAKLTNTLLAMGHGPKLVGKVFTVSADGHYVDIPDPVFAGTLQDAVA